jgi:hypothetical protein
MTYTVKIIDDVPVEIHTVVVHEFCLGDVEDPELFAAEPIWKWQQTELGQWVMENAMDKPIWHRHMDNNIWVYKYAITAKLKDPDYVWFLLKYKDH